MEFTINQASAKKGQGMLVLLGNSLAPTLRANFHHAAAHEAISFLPASIWNYKSSASFSEILKKPQQGEPVTLIQSLGRVDGNSINDFAMQLMFTVDVLKKNGAGPIWVVLPYSGYGRQDRGGMVSAGIDTYASALKHFGVVGMSVVDMHSKGGLDCLKNNFGTDQVYNIQPTQIYALDIVNRALDKDAVGGGPDAGSHERATALVERLGLGEFKFKKLHTGVSDTKVIGFEGDVKSRRTITVDDELDTTGTMTNAQLRLKEEGAIERHVYAAHGVFSDGGLERIFTSGARGDRTVTSISVTDSIDISFELERLRRQYESLDDINRVRVLSIGRLLALHVAGEITLHPAMQP